MALCAPKKNPTILEIIFKHSRFHEPKDLHILVLREIIQSERTDLVKRIMAINPYSGITMKDNYFPSSAIIASTTFRQYNITKVLLIHGAPVDVLDLGGTPLSTCVLHNDIPMARLLLEHGADPDFLDTRSYPPIFSASSVGMIQLLVDFKADPDKRDNLGRTLIRHKINNSELEFLESILDASTRSDLAIVIDHKDAEGNTPLHHAAFTYDLRCVRFLLNHGADIDARNNIGDTPLFNAISWNKVDVVRLLLDYGANPKLTNNAGKTVIDIAQDYEYEETHVILGYLTT